MIVKKPFFGSDSTIRSGCVKSPIFCIELQKVMDSGKGNKLTCEKIEIFLKRKSLDLKSKYEEIDECMISVEIVEKNDILEMNIRLPKKIGDYRMDVFIVDQIKFKLAKIEFKIEKSLANLCKRFF